MSITCGIVIWKKDTHERIDTTSCVSWKNWAVDMWICDWIFTYKTSGKPDFFEHKGECVRRSVRKDDILRMADDMTNRRFNVCPDAYEYFEGYEQEEKLLAGYGPILRKLAEKVQDDEMLIYYDYGN